MEAEILIWQGKSKDARSLLEDTLPDSSPDEALIRRKIIQAIALYRLQEFDQSASALSEAEQLALPRESDLIADIQMARGSLAVAKRDYQSAETFYQTALKLARKQQRLFLETSVLGNLGVLALRQQQCGEAIDWFTLVDANAKKLGNATMASKTLINLGWCYYTLGDFDGALDNYTRAQTISTKLGALQDEVVSLNNIGLIYDTEGDPRRAAEYYQQSLQISNNLGDRSASATALSNLALAALRSGNLPSAEQYNKESLQLRRDIGDTTGALYPVLNAGRIAMERKQYPEATKLFREVIHGAGNDESLRWEAESELAALYTAEGKPVTAGLQYEKGLATIDRARAALAKDEHRLSFLNTATRFYNDYIDFLVAHHREREALAVAEHSRARTLAEGLKLPVSKLRAAEFHPEENARRQNSVVLSYWLKPERSYLWVVTPKRVQLFTLPPQNEIDAAVEEYRKTLLGPVKDSAAGEKLYRMLVAPAEKLIATTPLKPKEGLNGAPVTAPRVIVIADGSLLSLNFETLMVPTPQPHYWIEDATISSAAAIALLRASTHDRTTPPSRIEKRNARRVGHDKDKLLLIGAPNYAGTDFPELTQAKLEVQKVENYFPADERTVIEGKAAIPTAYDQSKPGDFGYIHFVAHATASHVSPLDSSIVLSKEGDAYKLYARDIMQQPLKADLVTISACYGAGNRAYSGEGLVGLSWAFLRAGAHNVIAALWEVNDASTPQLMDDLYKNVKNGEDPATALRHAKLDMLHSANVYRRPFYWGAFQLYIGS